MQPLQQQHRKQPRQQPQQQQIQQQQIEKFQPQEQQQQQPQLSSARSSVRFGSGNCVINKSVEGSSKSGGCTSQSMGDGGDGGDGSDGGDGGDGGDHERIDQGGGVEVDVCSRYVKRDKAKYVVNLFFFFFPIAQKYHAP